MVDGNNDGTAGATVDQTADVFMSMLSAPAEERKERETPPAQDPAPEQPEPQAAEPATEDQGESPEPEQPDAPVETPETTAIDPSVKVKTKVDGQEIEVTLEEALKGYSRTQDYTRKTQALAEKTKAFEGETQAVRAERAQVAERLKSLDQILDEVKPKKPNWEQLKTEDPARFANEWAAWDQYEQERQAVSEARKEAEAKVAEDNTRHHQLHLEAERTKLIDAIPEWKSEDVSKADKAKMVTYAEKLGFDNQRLAQVDDHRILVMLRKSMLYDEMQAKKPAIVARIDKVKTAAPGGVGVSKPAVSDTTRTLQRLAKTGKQEDAAAAILTMLRGGDPE